MKLVKNNHCYTGQAGVALNPTGQDTLCDHLNTCGARTAAIETNSITDRLPDLFTAQLCHPASSRQSSDSPWFQHDNTTHLRSNYIEQSQRNAGRFAGPRRCMNNKVLM